MVDLKHPASARLADAPSALRGTSAGFAPIALFAHKRPEHTRRALQALACNAEFENSPLHVYCDGPRNDDQVAAVTETQRVVRDFPHPNMAVIAAETNKGLAKSITGAVTSLCNEHGQVIVVEDDLVVSPGFLSYMNRALNRYADEARVMQISGYMFPVDLGETPGSVFLPFTTSWGWATWQRAWKDFDGSMDGAVHLGSSVARRIQFDLDGSYPYFRMLQRQMASKVDSWAIRWYLSVFLCSGLVLFPRKSLVENHGFDGSGTHCGEHEARPTQAFTSGSMDVDTIDPIATDERAFKQIKKYLRSQRSTARLIGDWTSRLLPAFPEERSNAR